jgi:hypothetical protein
MSNTAKISISVPDESLLEWAKERSAKLGVSLSAVFMDAVRIERQMEARRTFLASWPERPKLTPEDHAAINAEWEGGPRYEPRGEPKTPQYKAKKKARVATTPKKRRAA